VITALPVTSQLDKTYPFEVLINLDRPSKVLLDQITTIDKVYLLNIKAEYFYQS